MNTTRFENVALFTTPLTYTVTHFITLDAHEGTIELSLKKNPDIATNLDKDLLISFAALPNSTLEIQSPGVQLKLPPYTYKMTGLKGTIHADKKLHLKIGVFDFLVKDDGLKLEGLSIDYSPKQPPLNVTIDRLLAGNEALQKLVLTYQEDDYSPAKPITLAEMDFEHLAQRHVSLKNENLDIDVQIDGFRQGGELLESISGHMKLPQVVIQRSLAGAVEKILAQNEKALEQATPLEKKKFHLLRESIIQDLYDKLLTATFRSLKPTLEASHYVWKKTKDENIQNLARTLKRKSWLKGKREAWDKLPFNEAVNEVMYETMMLSSGGTDLTRDWLASQQKLHGEDPRWLALDHHVNLYDNNQGNTPNKLNSPIFPVKYIEAAKALITPIEAAGTWDRITLLLAARLAHSRDDEKKFYAHLDQAAELEPNPVRKLYLRFYKHKWMEKAEALKLSKEIVQLEPQSSFAQYTQVESAGFLLESGDKLGYETIMKTHYDGPYTQFSRRMNFMMFLVEEKRFAQAGPYIENCFTQETNHYWCELHWVDLHLNQATPLIDSSRYDEALVLVENVLARYPLNSNAIYKRAFISFKKGNDPDARQDFSRACLLGSPNGCKYSRDPELTVLAK